MTIEEMLSAVTNVGFPVALSLMLLRYVLKNFEEKFEKLDKSLHELTISIREKKDDSTLS
ncbi:MULTISPECIES: hypothetical protein [Saccharibacillus]|nr:MULTISPECIES: hypothetical protein [Saccharibacillus]